LESQIILKGRYNIYQIISANSEEKRFNLT
jgi:hypothetical protein